MQLNEFKVGDIIYRTSPTVDNDQRFIGNRFKFLGYEGLVFFGRFLNPKYIRDHVIAIGGTKWFDSNWEKFPEAMYQQVRAENKVRVEARKVAREQAKAEKTAEKDGKDL
jgi:hypothetical protein